MILKTALLFSLITLSISAPLQKSLPIGTIIAWNPETYEDALPAGWELCDGQKVEGNVN